MPRLPIFTLTTLAAATLAGSVQAQSASGFYMTGFAEGSYIGAQKGIEGDITLGYDGIADMPIGVEVGLFGYDIGAGLLSSVTGAIYYDTDYGRFSVGKPRAAIDDYISETPQSHYPVLNYVRLQLFGSDTRAAMFYTPARFTYGLRFDGAFNGVEYGLSYHAMTGGEYSLTAAASYNFADYYTVGLGVEQIPRPGGHSYSFLASFEAAYDNFGISVMAKQYDGMGGLPLRVYTAKAYYDWNDLELYTNYFQNISGSQQYIFGAKYTIFENGYIGIEKIPLTGLTIGDYNVYAGWNFAIGG